MSTARLLAPPSLGRLLLGHDSHQRMRSSQNLLALVLIAFFAAVQQFEAGWGLLDQDASNWLSLFSVGTSLGSYLLIRSGASLRLAPEDPSLTFPQCTCAVVSVCWSYAITGPARGGLLAILVLIILFGTLFRLRLRQTRLLSLFAFVLLALVMAWRTSLADVRYDAQVELVNFAFTVIVLAGANAVTGRFVRLRERLTRQRAELAKALELNRELATRDMLTGLLNRRAMVEMLVRPLPRRQRGDGKVALAILDLDHFKRINDTCGHRAGDAVLQRFAQLLGSAVRKGDLLARWGGEEFLLLMPGTSDREGVHALARLRDAVACEDWSLLVGGLAVTFSAGLTDMVAGEDHESAIERADQAMYRAKNGGRNRIERA